MARVRYLLSPMHENWEKNWVGMDKSEPIYWPNSLDCTNSDTLKFLLYVPVRMPARQYLLCTSKTAQCRVHKIGALE